MKELQFTSYEIKERLHSPNAVVGVTAGGAKHLLFAPVNTLGKKQGDEMAKFLMEALSNNTFVNIKAGNLLDEVDPNEVNGA